MQTQELLHQKLLPLSLSRIQRSSAVKIRRTKEAASEFARSLLEQVSGWLAPQVGSAGFVIFQALSCKPAMTYTILAYSDSQDFT